MKKRVAEESIIFVKMMELVTEAQLKHDLYGTYYLEFTNNTRGKCTGIKLVDNPKETIIL